jgi:ribulose-5-phosphate 4-epimerase/fuculose-1-phosphate aldolase
MKLQETNRSVRYDESEWRTRLDLAACYRLADMFGFSDIIWNHITAKIPGTEHFLINRFGLRHDEITASNLVTIDGDGDVIDPGNAESAEDINVTGFVIHSAIHTTRTDIHYIFHSHSSAGLAVSALREGLLPLIQDGIPLYAQMAYHDYEGLSVDTGERERLAQHLGEKKALILRNHGILTCGETVGEAFMLMYYLERACKVQMQVLASGQPYDLIDPEIVEKTAAQYRVFPPGQYEWPALLRLVEQKSPDYSS